MFTLLLCAPKLYHHLGVSPAFLFTLGDPRHDLGALLTGFPPGQESILDMVSINVFFMVFHSFGKIHALKSSHKLYPMLPQNHHC